MALLPRRFYARDADKVARDLIGTTLAGDVDGKSRRARIVETEAYVGPHDLASHSRHGPTRRNASMFGPPGHAYVYLVYGMHNCLNVVVGERDGQAVLLRAGEPLDGWDARLSGPALLASAFGVTRAHDGLDLVHGGTLRMYRSAPQAARRGAAATTASAAKAGSASTTVATSARIGVHCAKEWADAPLRFFDPASLHVSGGSRNHKPLHLQANRGSWRKPPRQERS